MSKGAQKARDEITAENSALEAKKQRLEQNLDRGDPSSQSFVEKALGAARTVTSGEYIALAITDDDSDGNKLSTEDYSDYVSRLDKAKSDVKARWSKANEKYREESLKLMSSYNKLYKLLKSSQGEYDINDKEKKELEAHRFTRKKEILQEIEGARKAYHEKLKELEMQEKNFKLMQKDQGRVVSTVEKHKVYDIKVQRAGMRNQAHVAILEALISSPALSKLTQAQQDMHIHEVEKLLRDLEQVEENTDELVERLALKVAQIQENEYSQNSAIEESLDRAADMNDRLDALNETIIKNNESLRGSTNKLKEDIAQNINGIISNANKRIWVYAAIGILFFLIVATAFLILNQAGVLG